MVSILEGIRILDWTIWQQGPSATAMLGDMGAEVIKLEHVSGDPSRGILDILDKMVDIPLSWNFYFEYLNRNKKSIAIDLKGPRGKEIVYRMIEKCDVFAQNFRKGVAERLGLGYEDLKKYNGKLIYATASGYGPDGPDSAEPSFDYMGLARSGIMNCLGEPDTPPTVITGGVADQMGAIMLAYGIMAAIIARERHGIGQMVDISHLGSMIHLQGLNVQAGLSIGQGLPKVYRSEAGNPLWNHYKCADGKWICLGMLQSDRYWHDFSAAMGISDLEHDPRFKDASSRKGNRTQLVRILDERFATLPRDEWVKILHDGGDFIFTIVNSIEELSQDPQALINRYIVNHPHPVHGNMKVTGFPVGFSGTPCSIHKEAPKLGENTREVLEKYCGYSRTEIEEMLKEKVVSSSEPAYTTGSCGGDAAQESGG